MVHSAGKQTELLDLPPLAPGMPWQLRLLRWSAGDGPHVHLQAAVHAEEIPPLLVAHELERRLDELAAAGRLCGTISLVPFANPLGLTQFIGGTHLGRFEFDSGSNFNRGYPDLGPALVAALAGKLGDDAAGNVALIRRTLCNLLDAGVPAEPLARLKWQLFRLACTADVVLDLHCDYEAQMHLYAHAGQWPQLADLAHELHIAVTLLADDSGGAAFDESCVRPFDALRAACPDAAIPLACQAATLELRGERDVSRALAAQDVEGIVRFLIRRGVVIGDSAPAGFAAPRSTRLEAVDVLMAPATGVLVWDRELGTEVADGEVVGHVVVPGTQDAIPIRTRTAGLFFVRRGHRWVRHGHMIGKVAGSTVLPWRKSGALLYD